MFSSHGSVKLHWILSIDLALVVHIAKELYVNTGMVHPRELPRLCGPEQDPSPADQRFRVQQRGQRHPCTRLQDRQEARF
jgi:hypothetical protein